MLCKTSLVSVFFLLGSCFASDSVLLKKTNEIQKKYAQFKQTSFWFQRKMLHAKPPQYERLLIVLVPSYNNKDWYAVNLASIFAQKYTNYHVVYIDDNSLDGTADLVEKYVKEHKYENKLTLIRNKKRLYAAANRYYAINACPDQAIIVNLDGDDWWLRDDALTVINYAYENPNVWLTYSQFINWPTNELGYGANIPQKVVKEKSFRSYDWVIGQARTFYAWLYKQIKKEDLMHDGQFFTTTTDLAMMYPLMEMVGDKFKFIPDVYYMRNVATELNLFKVAHANQIKNGKIIRARAKYDQIKELPFDRLKDALLVNHNEVNKIFSENRSDG